MHLTSIAIEGGLLSPDFLETIHDALGQKPQDFGLKPRDSLVDEVTAIWGDIRAYWEAFQRRVARGRTGRAESLTTVTREQWVLPLLEALGYSLTFQRRAIELDDRAYAISHRVGPDDAGPPVHVVALDQDLGDRPSSGRGLLSPHALVQDYLNRTDEQVWGIVTNGKILRLLRDSTYFTRPTYIEFDLEAMLAGERLDEFFLFYRLVHRTRFPQPSARPTDCLLEHYYQHTLEQGGRIRDGLRNAVASAIVTFANGFLRHGRNENLRARLHRGDLTADGLYQQLLYLIYRLLFLMVAEERNLLEVGPASGKPPAPGLESLTPAAVATYYRQYASISRLRQLADAPLNAPERFDDLYLGLRTLFHAFHSPDMAARLGVPPLNGELFSQEKAPDLDASHLNNRDFLHAIRLLSHFTAPDEKVRRRINYGALDVEELGSVYESLLDEQPVLEGLGQLHPTVGSLPRPVAPSPRPLAFSFIGGTARKTTGSYYTPRELVNEVIKSALVPVITARLAAAKVAVSPPRPVTVSAEETAILSLRVCDPACGSGHFLLAAARRLGYELAKVRSGADEPAPDRIREATRDAITHCIYGVDKNPLAVDLCKVALWIEGHSQGKPLTFLDYRVRCGDSLVGVLELAVLDEGIPDAAFDPVTGDDKTTASSLKKQNRDERAGQMSLFDQLAGPTTLPDAAAWHALEQMPEDTPAQINAKQAQHQALQQRLQQARTAANLWTAAFFSQLTPDNLAFIPTTDSLRRYRQGQAVSAQVVGAANALAVENRFFHWPLEFPQVFGSGDLTGFQNLSGLTVPGGFDVVLGNPPWERIKLQEQEFFATRDPEIATALNKSEREKLIKQLPQAKPHLARLFMHARHAADATSKFLRASNRFPLTARGDINTYPLFAELGRSMLSAYGRTGMIVPSGLVTDYTTSFFFRDLIETKTLIAFFGMDNERLIFPAIDHRNKFGLLIEGGSKVQVDKAEFTFTCSRIEDLARPERRYFLGKEELFQINPNTGTCPTFRTNADAELTKKVYLRMPVMINEVTNNNPWQLRFATMFHMANDSNLFVTSHSPEYLPLYEAKIIWHFDHRYATYESATQAQLNVGSLPKLDEVAHQDPFRQIKPRYWIHRSEVTAKLANWNYNWLIGFREVANNNLERTIVVSLLPATAVGHKAPLIFSLNKPPSISAMLLIANMNSLVFDFVARQKIGGVSISYFILNQLPVLAPSQYTQNHKLLITPLLFELVYTAWDIAPFATDLWQEADEPLRHALRAQWEANRQATGGHPWPPQSPVSSLSVSQSPPPFPPFKWDDTRRAHLRAELDAYYARLYGLSRDELRYILDPADIYGPEFPGETFRVLKEKEIKAHGEYRTQRFVLAAWDSQQAAIDRGELTFDTPPAPQTPAPIPSKADKAPTSTPVAPTPVSHTPAPRAIKEPAPALELSQQPTPPQPQTRPQPKPTSHPVLDARLFLPDPALATSGSFSQRLKRANTLVADLSVKATAELITFLGAPESALQWLAQTTLEKRRDETTAALLHAFLSITPNPQTQQLVQTILVKIEE